MLLAISTKADFRVLNSLAACYGRKLSHSGCTHCVAERFKDTSHVVGTIEALKQSQISRIARTLADFPKSLLQFPLDFFPVLFAVPRVTGWLAHWRQMMMQKGGVKIWRPRQVYVGEAERDYQSILERDEKKEAKLGSEPTKVCPIELDARKAGRQLIFLVLLSQVPHLSSKRTFIARSRL